MREERLRSLDQAIGEFYPHKRQAFRVSTGLFFLGWIAETLEVYVINWYSGRACMALSGLSIAVLAGLYIKKSAFFIPGSLGARDGGKGLSSALLRPFQAPAWIGMGWRCPVIAAKNGIEGE